MKQPRDFFFLPEIVLCVGEAAFAEALEELGAGPEQPQEAWAMTVTVISDGQDRLTSCVYVDADAAAGETDDVAALLAHEASHIADDYFTAIGEVAPSSEYRAYLVEAVMAALLSQLREG